MPGPCTKSRGVIFDLDGVLIHSANIHDRAFQTVFKEFNITNFDYSQYAGQRTVDVVQKVLGGLGVLDAETINRVAKRKSELAREGMAITPPLDPECGAVLADLAADHALALASSGSRLSVEAFLSWSGSRSLFQSVLSSEDVTHSKPDPELYTTSLNRLDLAGLDCWVVEDATAGVKAAKAAGCHVIGLPGTSKKEDLEQAGADRIISHLSVLPGLLRGDAKPEIQRSCWSAVIPAAGRGTRLGFHRSKILYPVAGRPILDWLLDFLTPNCSKLVFVLSPEGSEDVTSELNQRIPGKFEVVIQETPTGMGDAVALGLAKVQTPHVAVVWGDQVALRRSSVESSFRLHQGPLHPDLTCPTVLRSNPYIHFERDAQGSICGLLQKREGDVMPEHGESDTGFFCFETGALRRLLEQLRSSKQGSGNATREFNLLPMIPLAAAQGKVLTPRQMVLEETMGINSSQDAVAVEAFLRG
jgi:HAD superfamily hydrolase (TIGR01509 family)